MRDFARAIVEALKPKANIFGSWLFWVIVVVAFIILGAIFFQPVVNAIAGFTEPAVQAASTASNVAVTPR